MKWQRNTSVTNLFGNDAGRVDTRTMPICQEDFFVWQNHKKKGNTRMKMFASKEKGYNRQLATAYIAGMMIGSYFYKSRFASIMEEKHLYLHYAEMPRARQYEEEEKLLRAMSGMERSFLRRIGELKCQIRCGREGERYVLTFDTGGFESLRCEVDLRGGFVVTCQDV